MNKTLYYLYIKTTKEDKTKVHAIHMSGEINISFIRRDVRKSNIDFIEIACPPMKRQTIICISDFW
jgi:hypothetical protein